MPKRLGLEHQPVERSPLSDRFLRYLSVNFTRITDYLENVLPNAVALDLTEHIANADPHSVYQKESEKNSANGYAGLDASTLILDSQIPSGIARDAEVATEIATHAATPHNVHPDLAAHDTLGLATQSELDTHAAGPHGGSGLLDIVSASRSSGNITLNGTSWANVDTGLDLVLNAVAGDWIDVSPSGRLAAGAGSTHTFFDVATIVGGSPVNYFGTAGGASEEGINGWRCQDTADARITGSALRQLVSGDISSGTVTLRLRYRQDTAGNRLFVAGTSNPFKWWAKNLGQG